MKKIKLSNEEKNQILESHNKYRDILMGHLFDKSLVSEQAAPAQPQQTMTPSQFFELAKQKCNRESPVQKAKPGRDGEGKEILLYNPTERKVSNGKLVWEVGDVVYIYPDGTYIVTITKDGRTAVRNAMAWSCPGLTFPTNRLDNILNSLRKNFKYKFFDELDPKDQAAASMEGQQQYEVITVGDKLLYRPKTMYVGPVTDEEIKIINSFLSSSYGFDAAGQEGNLWKMDVTPEEQETMYKVVLPKSAGLTRDFEIYLDIRKLPVQLQNKILKKQSKELDQLFNEKNCASIILNYYNMWKEKDPVPYSTLEQEKEKVRMCLRRDYKYGTLGIGGGNVEKAILALMGRETGDNRRFPPMTQSGKDTLRHVVKPTSSGRSFDFRLNR